MSLSILAGGFGSLLTRDSHPKAGVPTLTLESTTAAERLVLEQAIAYARGMTRLALTAPHGTVQAACEALALTAGRRLLRDSLAAALQARADATDAQKKAPTPAPKGGTPAGG